MGAAARISGPHADATLMTGARRVALMPGCVQQVVAPEIDEAVSRVLARRGMSLMPLRGAGCCGALAHHLGRQSEAKASARRAIKSFESAGGADAFQLLLISATGCAAHIKDYPHLFANEPDWQARAAALVSRLGQLWDAISAIPNCPSTNLRVALHVPCSLQHGLGGSDGGALLSAAGFEVVEIPEGHLCCGSAGSYSLLQPEIASRLRERKLQNIGIVQPDVIATTNIGCLQHLNGSDAPPVVHLAELLDWVEGGPAPGCLRDRRQLIPKPDLVH